MRENMASIGIEYLKGIDKVYVERWLSFGAETRKADYRLVLPIEKRTSKVSGGRCILLNDDVWWMTWYSDGCGCRKRVLTQRTFSVCCKARPFVGYQHTRKK